ncbi:MAG: glycosyltransferase family 2 protein, partial [Elusimicrobia bacterium]|nr:glycosyltransferase family 2 protein [Elusimicrobiota bacterium]
MATLSIVIPAYNEESAIEAIIARCLGAREMICREAGLSSVEIIVVDDGSRDRTRALASGFSGISLIPHPANRGYGAALLTGFSAASGDYLGFLDADGTCDPLAFIELYRALARSGADMAVGNRLHGGSRMPKLRALGNRFYAAVISRLSGTTVRDSASGMRLFSRGLLDRLR